MQNRFDCLALHEETEPAQVAKLSSKRAQKRLSRAASCGTAVAYQHEPSGQHQPFSAFANGHTPVWVYGSEEKDLEMAIQASIEHAASCVDEFLPVSMQVSCSTTSVTPACCTSVTPALAAPSRAPPLAMASQVSYANHNTNTSRDGQRVAAEQCGMRTVCLPQMEFPVLPSPSRQPPPASPKRLTRPGQVDAPITARSNTPSVARFKGGIRIVTPARPPPDEEELPRPSGADLYWDLRMEGMQPLSGDSLTEGLLDERDTSTKVAVLAAEEALQQRQLSCSQGVSTDRMLDMMYKTSLKQCGVESEPTEVSTQFDSVARSKEWRVQVNTMLQAGWEPIAASNNHFKFRRQLPNGKHQITVLSCSPSDVRAINNVQARVARQDRQAAEMIEQDAAATSASKASTRVTLSNGKAAPTNARATRTSRK